jgi:hypothetical protein
MQTVHIKSSCVYLPIRVLLAVGFVLASRRCHILDCEILRNFRVELVLAVEGALRAEGAGCSVDAIVRSVMIGSVISTVESVLSLVLFLPCLVVDDRSEVEEIMIYTPLISFPARAQDDGEEMEYYPS